MSRGRRHGTRPAGEQAKSSTAASGIALTRRGTSGARTEPKDSHRSKKPHWHARFERAEGAEIQQGSTKYGSGS